MSPITRIQVAMEFGFAKPLIQRALLKQDFKCAGDLVQYLEEHEEELKQDMKEETERVMLASSELEKTSLLTLREETEILYRNSLCFVCLKNPRTVLTLPCCHFLLCKLCLKKIEHCPVSDCASPIYDVINTFVS